MSTTTTGPRFAIRIGPETEAGYAQPAAAPGRIALEYPIWIDGSVSALSVPLGRVTPLPITPALRQETAALRQAVLDHVGPLGAVPAGPVANPLEASGGPDEPVTEGQRVAEMLHPYAPPGVRFGAVQLWKGGGALNGYAPNEAAVRELVVNLNRGGEVRNAQVAFMRPEGAGLQWRVLVNLMCDAPDAPSRCLPGTGSAYTQQQVEAALRPLLAPAAADARITLTADGEVLLEVPSRDERAVAALDQITDRVNWVDSSRRGYKDQRYILSLRMRCPRPPSANGLCMAQRGPR